MSITRKMPLVLNQERESVAKRCKLLKSGMIRVDYDRAFEGATEALNIDSTSASTYHTRGAALAAKGDQDSAIADYRKALEHWQTVSVTRCKRYEQEMRDFIEQPSKPD